MSDELIFARKRGEESFYTPSRDVLQVWPSCIVRGAAFAADPRSDIFHWLIKSSDLTNENVVPSIRKCLSTVLEVIDECRTAPLMDVLTPDRVDWSVFKAIMFGASIVMFNTYNKEFRKSRMTALQGGAIQEPTPHLDNEYCLKMYDKLVLQAREGGDA